MLADQLAGATKSMSYVGLRACPIFLISHLHDESMFTDRRVGLFSCSKNEVVGDFMSHSLSDFDGK